MPMSIVYLIIAFFRAMIVKRFFVNYFVYLATSVYMRFNL